MDLPTTTPLDGTASHSTRAGRRRVKTKELLDAAANRWSEIYARLAPQFREAIEYAGGSRHVLCPVHGGEHGDAFRMYPDWQETGGVICNSCGAFPNGVVALNWLHRQNHERTLEDVAAILGIDQPRRRGRPKSTAAVTAGGTLKVSSGTTKVSSATADTDRHAKQIEIARRRAKILDRWQSAIPDNGTLAAYFTHRGLSIPVPPSLKLVESLTCYGADPSDQKKQIPIGDFPAMLAQVMHPTLGIVAIHRTYLAADGHGKAQLPNGQSAKKLTPPIYDGATVGAAIRLYPATNVIALAEGIETAIAVHQATGTPSWSTVSAGGLSSVELPKEIATVEIWADPGDVGQQAAKQAAERLAAEGRTIFVVSPPADQLPDQLPDQTTAGDWLDILNASGPAALVAAREAAQEFRRAIGEVRDIYLRTTEHEVTDEVSSAIADDPYIFCRGGQLVHLVADASRSRPGILRPSIAPRIAILPDPRLRERITACCRLLHRCPDGSEVPHHPPQWLVQQVAARGRWPAIRHLEAIVEIPILRHDGSIVSKPGYDPITGVYYEPDSASLGDGSTIPTIPINPTATEIQAAAATILDVVKDFPFATPAHQSAWLAAVLTPFARFAFRGPAPLFLIDANVRGAGKSLLCDLVGLIVSGREMARMVNTRADDEMRKRITAIAIAGDPLVLIDNITDSLGGAGLDAALTSSTWSDRILGKSENTVPMPLSATWYATGNNVVLRTDIARRVCHVRLESPEENPEERTAFAHTNIRDYVFRSRPTLIAAALTILRGYTAALSAGKPPHQFTPWGSFEGWSNLVRGAIINAGLADPGDTREQVREESDSEGQTLRAFISAWEKLDPQNNGMTISEAIKSVETFLENEFENAEKIKSAFIEFAPGKDFGKINARSIGMKLHHMKGRVCGGKSLMRKTSVDHSIVWYISQSKGTTGSTGTIFSHQSNHNNTTVKYDNVNTCTRDSNYVHKTYMGWDSTRTASSPRQPENAIVEEIL